MKNKKIGRQLSLHRITGTALNTGQMNNTQGGRMAYGSKALFSANVYEYGNYNNLNSLPEILEFNDECRAWICPVVINEPGPPLTDNP